MIVYVNGCSHTEDVDKNNTKYTWPRILMGKLSELYGYYRVIGCSLNNRIDNSMSGFNQIKTDMLINDSVCGASNDYIFHTSLESINELLNNKIKPDLVIIQWSGPNRRENCDHNGNISFITPYENLDHHLKFEPMASKHTLHYMFSLQEILTKNGINHLFFNYMGLDESIKNTNVLYKIDKSKVLDFGNDTIFNGLIDLFRSNGFIRDVQGHPNKLGSECISNKILEKLFI